MNPALFMLSPPARRLALANEDRFRRSGEWGAWERISVPAGALNKGWTRFIDCAYRNRVFCVLWRPLASGAKHLAISSLSGSRPTWHEAQRIKNDLGGRDKTAVEIYPPADEVVDGADVYHLWVLAGPSEFSLFGDGL